MAQSIPTTEPNEFAAGETVQWRRSYGDYSPTDGWTLKYYFVGPSLFTVTAADTAGEWRATVTPATTTNKKAGTYRWTLYAEQGSPTVTERRRVAAGTLTLTADITAAGPGSLAPLAETALPIIEAAITGRLTADQQSFQIDGTAITNIPIIELKRLRAEFRSELWRKRNAGVAAQPVHLRFVRPS